MALEYMFYMFFGLCLMAMCAGFVSEVLRNHQRAARAVVVDHSPASLTPVLCLPRPGSLSGSSRCGDVYRIN
jgi:hypothetical protein